MNAGAAGLAGLCEDLADGHWAVWQDLGLGHVFLRQVRAATTLDAPGIPWRDLEVSYAALTRDIAITNRSIAAYFRSEFGASIITSIDTLRLAYHAAALVAAGRAATAARRRLGGEPSEGDELVRWVARTAAALERRSLHMDDPFGLPNSGQPTLLDAATPAELVGTVCSMLSDTPLSQEALDRARFWIWYVLGALPEPTPVPLSIPWAAVDTLRASDAGHIYDLVLTPQPALQTAAPVLIEHPEGALRPLGPDLLAAVQAAWNLSRPAITWMIATRGGSASQNTPLDGFSIGGAAAVGMRCARDGLLYDRACLVVAKLGATGLSADGTLAPVGWERDKLMAALGAEMRRAVVADAQAVGALHLASLSTATGQTLEVQEAATVEAAVHIASGQYTGLHKYFSWLGGERRDERRDERREPAYLNGRDPATLYVPPDVLVREPSRPEVEDHFGARRPDGARGMGDADDGAGVSIYDQRRAEARERERRRSWADVRDQMRPGSRYEIVAPAGQGKTALTISEGARLAVQALTQLAAQEGTLDTVELPIIVRLPDLAHQMASEGSADARLRSAFQRTLVGAGCSEAAARYLTAHAHEARTWLFLDALDEVQEVDQDALAELLQALDSEQWQSRVIITSRPSGVPIQPPLRDVTELVLARLTNEQAHALVNKWFPDNGEIGREPRERLLAWLNEPAVREMSESPFLLTLLCWVVERHPPEELEQKQELTRAVLYDRVVRDLLGLRRERSRTLDERRAQELLRLLEPMALHFFELDAARASIPHDHLRDYIASSEMRPTPRNRTQAQLDEMSRAERADAIIEELEEKRVLMASGIAYFFPHRSILEYLTGRELAKRLIAEMDGVDGEHLESAPR